MDEELVERILSDENTQAQSGEPSPPEYARTFIRSRISFAIALGILTIIPWVASLWILSWAFPTFTANASKPVLLGSAIFIFIAIGSLLYLNDFLRKHHKIIVGGAYGVMGVFMATVVIINGLMGVTSLSAILLTLLLACGILFLARATIRSHYQRGGEAWATDE